MSLKKTVTYVKLNGIVFRVDLRADVKFQAIKIADLYLNPDTIDRIFTDSLSHTDILLYSLDKRADDPVYITEDLAFAMSKAFTDSVGFTENVDILRTLGLSFTDTPTMSDAAVVSFAGAHNETVSVAEVLNYAMQKALTDTATMSDSPVLNPNLGKTDSVSFSDVFTRVVTFERSFADAISLDDRTSLADPLATDVSGNKTNIVSMADVLAYAWEKARSDSFSMAESHAIDFTPGGFTDSFSFADSETVDTSLSKSDSFSFADSETLSNALSKSDSFSFTDNETLSTSLGKSDSFSFTDVQTFDNAIGKADSLNITETHSFSLGKSAQDSATISESISILNANRQSALNASALNSNTLN